MLNKEGRPTAPEAITAAPAATFTGNRALAIEEALIFEIGRPDVMGVDIDQPPAFKPRLGGQARKAPLNLPGLSEPETMRHYVRLSRQNYAIDMGLYPLGSCTMKHNPRLNEKMARLPGFADVHPLQPLSTVPGAVDLIAEVGRWLIELTGMAAVAMSPKAGAHGEACGMMAIKAALAARGEAEKRKKVLVPLSAHGTNPATAALLGLEVVDVPGRPDGTVDPEVVASLLNDEVAALMLTNPNTCGLFERDIVAIAKAVHKAGAYLYADGANFNAIVGKVRPGDLGVDAMHINLHKTFSTPHGGGGPGAGPVVLSPALAPFAPLPFVRIRRGRAELVESAPAKASRPAKGKYPNPKDPAWVAFLESAAKAVTISYGDLEAVVPGADLSTAEIEDIYAAIDEAGANIAADDHSTPGHPFGRLTAFHGQMGMFTRAMAYMLSHGADGLRQASEDAVLNANYVRACLKDIFSQPFGDRVCMHEVLFDDRFLDGTGVTTLDFAKAMIDEGYHPMTMYFPLVVHGAMLIEPTESESLASLDLFIAALRDLAMRAKAGGKEALFKAAPQFAPRRRLDETRAARAPRLKWEPPAPYVEAAE
ncbi:MAG: aminomethyl-transferring glycine dehydrogenase subunit GcvPB [Bauldia sp.]